jgi:hypothetical protein
MGRAPTVVKQAQIDTLREELAHCHAEASAAFVKAAVLTATIDPILERIHAQGYVGPDVNPEDVIDDPRVNPALALLFAQLGDAMSEHVEAIRNAGRKR